jgi:hypothetical protein
MLSALPTQAIGLYFGDITINDTDNSTAKMHWNTNQPTVGTVYFGTDPNNLYRYISTNTYNRNHTSYLTGLEEKTTYYYKIVARNQSNQQIETFVKNFKTDKIIDDSEPEIITTSILQTTGDAIALYFETNKPTKALFQYGLSSADNLNKSKRLHRYTTRHLVYISGLETMTRYNIKITAEDKNGAKDYHIMNDIRTSTKTKRDYSQMTIDNIRPIGPNSDMISINSIDFTYYTNLVTESYIQYGTAPNKLKSRVYANDGLQAIGHEATLTNLKPNTTYYYKIYTKNGLYRRSTKTEIQTFTTRPAPHVLGLVITSDQADNDNDGLSNNYELSIGTDPNNRDTDGDGYNDGLEIDNGYNPLGPGKYNIFKYNKPRSSSSYEMEKSIELKEGLENILGNLNLRTQDWFTVVNAYVYGEYPIEAIAQSIKHGGKTVHPTIAWDFWQKAKDYINYINL